MTNAPHSSVPDADFPRSDGRGTARAVTRRILLIDRSRGIEKWIPIYCTGSMHEFRWIGLICRGGCDVSALGGIAIELRDVSSRRYPERLQIVVQVTLRPTNRFSFMQTRGNCANCDKNCEDDCQSRLQSDQDYAENGLSSP